MIAIGLPSVALLRRIALVCVIPCLASAQSQSPASKQTAAPATQKQVTVSLASSVPVPAKQASSSFSKSSSQAKTAATPPPPVFVPAPKEGQANRVLADGLADKNPDVRKEAAAALSLTAAREPYLSGLTSALDDKDIYVRLAAVNSLMDLRDQSAGPALAKALNDDAPEVSFAAAKALWALGDPRGRAALFEVLGGQMKTVSNPLSAEKRDMLRMFHTPRTLMLFAIRSGVGFVPVPGVGEGVSSLTMLMNDASVSGRAATILLIGRDPSAQVTVALRDALKDKDASVRAAAAHAIALRDDPVFMEDLVPLLTDTKDSARLRAAAGYVRLAGISAERQRKATPASRGKR